MTEDNDIPPPLVPEPPEDVLYLPYALADAPRLQLEFLARHPGIADSHREAIKKWLYQYNLKMIKWLHDNYGPEAVAAADAMSRSVVKRWQDTAKAERDEYERDFFNHLQREFDSDE